MSFATRLDDIPPDVPTLRADSPVRVPIRFSAFVIQRAARTGHSKGIIRGVLKMFFLLLWN